MSLTSYHRDVAKDQLPRNPRAARLILIVGVIVYFGLCWPLYGRRGFPEIDPFWLGMSWLWIPPVILSAIHDTLCRRRVFDLLLYALGAGFVLSWGTVMIVPSNKTPVDAMRELVFLGPAMVVGVFLVEGLIRLVLAKLRCFPPQPYCEHCGYWLRNLTVPRCPECGAPFSAALLDPDYCPAITPVLRRWTTLFFVLTLVAAAAFPFAYRAYAFYSFARSGERRAEQDWASGDVIWYVTKDELRAMTPKQQEHLHHYLPDNKQPGAWRMEEMWRDWQNHTAQSSYRRTIERKLEESGRSRPALD